MVSERQHKRYKDPEERRKVGERNKKFNDLNPEKSLINSQKRIEGLLNYLSNPENRKKLSERMKGDNNPMRKNHALRHKNLNHGQV